MNNTNDTMNLVNCKKDHCQSTMLDETEQQQQRQQKHSTKLITSHNSMTVMKYNNNFNNVFNNNDSDNIDDDFEFF